MKKVLQHFVMAPHFVRQPRNNKLISELRYILHGPEVSGCWSSVHFSGHVDYALALCGTVTML
jgi:hypothetical protein